MEIIVIELWCWKCNGPRKQFVLEKHFVTETCYLYKCQCSKCKMHNSSLKDPKEVEDGKVQV